MAWSLEMRDANRRQFKELQGLLVDKAKERARSALGFSQNFQDKAVIELRQREVEKYVQTSSAREQSEEGPGLDSPLPSAPGSPVADNSVGWWDAPANWWEEPVSETIPPDTILAKHIGIIGSTTFSAKRRLFANSPATPTTPYVTPLQMVPAGAT